MDTKKYHKTPPYKMANVGSSDGDYGSYLEKAHSLCR